MPIESTGKIPSYDIPPLPTQGGKSNNTSPASEKGASSKAPQSSVPLEPLSRPSSSSIPNSGNVWQRTTMPESVRSAPVVRPQNTAEASAIAPKQGSPLKSPIKSKHTLKADFDTQGTPTGGHMLSENVRLKPGGFKSNPDKNGVYKAEVQMRDGPNSENWKDKPVHNSMLPENMTERQALEAQNKAWANRHMSDNNERWEGTTPDGITFKGHRLRQQGNSGSPISTQQKDQYSAHPVYEPEKLTKPEKPTELPPLPMNTRWTKS